MWMGGMRARFVFARAPCFIGDMICMGYADEEDSCIAWCGIQRLKVRPDVELAR